jgi:hypothetical protein
VSIYYDGSTELDQGDALRTPTGRLYVVAHVRVQQRGKHAGRQHLRCAVFSPGTMAPPGTRVFPLHWYSRNPRKKT